MHQGAVEIEGCTIDRNFVEMPESLQSELSDVQRLGTRIAEKETNPQSEHNHHLVYLAHREIDISVG